VVDHLYITMGTI